MKEDLETEYKKVILLKTQIDFLEKEISLYPTTNGCYSKNRLDLEKELEICKKKLIDFIKYQNN